MAARAAETPFAFSPLFSSTRPPRSVVPAPIWRSSFGLPAFPLRAAPLTSALGPRRRRSSCYCRSSWSAKSGNGGGEDDNNNLVFGEQQFANSGRMPHGLACYLIFSSSFESCNVRHVQPRVLTRVPLLGTTQVSSTCFAVTIHSPCICFQWYVDRISF